MRHTLLCQLILLCLLAGSVQAQTGRIEGLVTAEGKPLPYATVYILNTALGSSTDTQGRFVIDPLPHGTHVLVVSFVGHVTRDTLIALDRDSMWIDLALQPAFSGLSEIVVTGTRTGRRQADNPVMVSVVNRQAMTDWQACNVSEGLKFQPGLRVETDCQTCNYTQLRMNGLGGGYSQILVNGRPVISPLMGLYGLEQLPASMIERIEVVRGGGSSLYGSSAVGGTVNLLTRIPVESSFELDAGFRSIDGQTPDRVVNGSVNLVSREAKAGLSLFLHHRDRDMYDANADRFSEIPLLRNRSGGVNLYYLPGDRHKLELSLSRLHEYRYGGDMEDQPPHLSRQAEERTHDVWMGNLDYRWQLHPDRSLLIIYAAWQQTTRDHYTGILPDEPDALQQHLANPPYGTSKAVTGQFGVQLDHQLPDFISGPVLLTVGSEFLSEDVLDEIPAYQYKVDQLSVNWGWFAQSDWEVNPALHLLTGLRLDRHSAVDPLILSPRLAFLYKWTSRTQLRLGYGAGFRAPQAFDADLHIAFAGGGVSRVQLDPSLREERSASLSASLTHDKATEKWVWGFTLEAFHTRLSDAFVLRHIGEDAFGEIFEKQNGAGATVMGVTAEIRANVAGVVQLEAGFTRQRSRFAEAVTYVQETAPTCDFLRTPELYGYSTMTLTPHPQVRTNINYVYTGPMKLAHFAGAPEQQADELVTSASFSDVSIQVEYALISRADKAGLAVYAGVKNVGNAYQSDFDSGKYRDSNYVYGPSTPRIFFVGARWSSR